MPTTARIVQSPLLGQLGRFANWLIQYQWSLKYARHCQAVLQTPEWIGETVFEINDERITNSVAVTPADRLPYCLIGTVAIPMFYDVPGHYASGIATRETMMSLKWRNGFDPTRVPQHEVVVHHRGGDFQGTTIWPDIEVSSLLESVRAVGVDTSRCHVIGSDIQSENDVYPRNVDYIYDFQLMVRAKVLFVYPDSTFSRIAGMMNPNTVFVPTHFTKGKTTCRFIKDH